MTRDVELLIGSLRYLSILGLGYQLAALAHGYQLASSLI
jgi:hypothetical protein